MPGGVVVHEKGAKPFLGAILCGIQTLAIHRRGRARTCQETCITVNICRHGFKQFWRLYILLNVIGSAKCIISKSVIPYPGEC